MADWRDGYRAAVGEYLQQHGQFVDLRHYPKHGWRNEPDDENDYDEYDTTYGWADYRHCMDESRYGGTAACQVVSVDMATMREQSLSQFENTFTSNKMHAGVEVRATCACGEYTNKWLRWEGTVGDILPALLAGTE